ncbi:hypothetical protein [Escherichia coli]|uniref:hypothetical protein n=1 Tax=Escherichia coli TaxID=562 RepID=UPI000A365EE0|nr:hypothetical protein [Escherichia coli]
MNKKYFVTDLYAHASEHSLFSKAFIQYFKDKDTIFLLNSIHQNFVDDKSISRTFPFKDSNVKNKWLRLFNREIIKLFTLIAYIPYIVITRRKLCILGASNLQFFILSFLFFLKPKIIVHGQAESLMTNKNDNSLAARLFINGFQRLAKHKAKLLFLSYHIKNNIKDKGSFYFIKHPLPKNGILRRELSDKKDSKLRVAMVGLLRNDKKNSNLIYSLNVNDNVELWAIGRAHHDFIINHHSNIKFKIWDSVYTDEEFEEAIKDIDAFLYLFNNEQYKMTASATALDAVIFQKIVFTLENDAVQSLLENYKNVYVANSIDELSNLINEFKWENKQAISKEIINDYILCDNNKDIVTIEEWLK